MDKASIIRKLAALKAKFADNSNCTEEEVASAMAMYNALMLKYNIEEKDIRFSTSDIGKSSFKYEGKQKPDIAWCVSAIGRLSSTRPIRSQSKSEFMFLGTRPDREYAEFLYRLCDNAIESNWKAFRYSYPYTKMIKEGHHGRTIRNTFRKVLALRLRDRMLELAAGNELVTVVNAIVLKKSELIQSWMDDGGMKTSKGTAVTRYVRHDNVIQAALDAAERVPLRHEVDEGKRLAFHGED